MNHIANDAENEISDELTITLRNPVKLGNEVITELNLHEPSVSQIEQFAKNSESKGPLTAMTLFIAAVANVNAVAIGMVGARDGKQAREYLMSFL